MVDALVGDVLLAFTTDSLHVKNLQLNQFSCTVSISWHGHQEREVKPEGELRSVKIQTQVRGLCR